jgi:Uma2 family endonuclease
MTVATRSASSVHANPAPLVIEGVSWETYEALLRDIDASGQHVRVTFDRGRVSIVAPLPRHGKLETLFSRFVEAIAEGRDIPISTFGSTTWKRRDRARGLEPDECFYIQHEPQVRGKLDIDLTRDPPPDLAIEVDLTRDPMDKLAVYAALNVPEVWSLDEHGNVQVWTLSSEGAFTRSDTSRAFPFLRAVSLKTFMDMYGSTDQNSILRAVREWARGL